MNKFFPHVDRDYFYIMKNNNVKRTIVKNVFKGVSFVHG